MIDLVKPSYGSACNNCGLCCIAEQCPLSLGLFGEQDICPALEKLDAGYGCGLIRNTADYVPDLTSWGGEALTEAFALMLGAGLGCDGTMEGEAEPTVAARYNMYAHAVENLERASDEARVLVTYFRGHPDESGLAA